MALVRAALRRAEELGYHSAWVQDQVAGDVPLLESISLLCYAAAVTSTLKLGVSVVVLPISNAAQLAKSVGTLDHMSNGRVILGIGLGPIFAGDNYFQIFGTRVDEALRRFNEGLHVMKSLWTQPQTDFAGEFYTLANAAMEPKPVQKPHPPVWFGAQHPAALLRAVRNADGYMGAGPTTTKDFAKNVEQIRRYLDQEGRDPSSFPLSKRVYLAVDNDADRAKAGLDAFFRIALSVDDQEQSEFRRRYLRLGQSGQSRRRPREGARKRRRHDRVKPVVGFRRADGGARRGSHSATSVTEVAWSCKLMSSSMPAHARANWLNWGNSRSDTGFAESGFRVCWTRGIRSPIFRCWRSRPAKIDLGPVAVNPFDTHPVKIASSFLTLNELADGRARIVIGGGGEALEALGIKPARRVRAVSECVEIMKAAATGERSITPDKFIRFAICGSPGSKRRTPPVYVGASMEQMLRMSARVADGIMMSDMPVPLAADAIEDARSGSDEIRQGPAGISDECVCRLACLRRS